MSPARSVATTVALCPLPVASYAVAPLVSLSGQYATKPRVWAPARLGAAKTAATATTANRIQVSSWLSPTELNLFPSIGSPSAGRPGGGAVSRAWCCWGGYIQPASE